MPLAAVRWLIALGTAFIALVIVQVGPSTNVVGVSGSSTQVIVMGDSIAAGYGVSYEERWATIFAEQTSNDLVNLSLDGTRSYGLVEQVVDWPSGRSQSQLDEALSVLAEEAPGTVSAVTLGIGLNDWLWLRDPATNSHCAVTSTPACDDLVANALGGVEANLHIILTELTAALETDTHLLVMTYYDIWNTDTSAAMNSIILSEIAEHGAIHVDVPWYFSGRAAEFIADTVHPSAAGHRMLADIFSNAIPPDSDNDGLADFVEVELGLNPAMPDTDGDGLEDGPEVLVYGSDPFVRDTDGDGCSDGAETSDDATLGGLRDPLNPWDFYDVAGSPLPPQNGAPDGVIDLPNDVLGVIQHISVTGGAAYDAQFDRGTWTGPNSWNDTQGPDGVIDLPNEILGVILQFSHRCV